MALFGLKFTCALLSHSEILYHSVLCLKNKRVFAARLYLNVRHLLKRKRKKKNILTYVPTKTNLPFLCMFPDLLTQYDIIPLIIGLFCGKWPTKIRQSTEWYKISLCDKRAQVNFKQNRAINYRALVRKMTYKDQTEHGVIHQLTQTKVCPCTLFLCTQTEEPYN